MTKLEEYTARASESLAALGAAGNERDRAHHSRAHAVWRKLIAGVAAAEDRAALAAEPRRSERSLAAARLSPLNAV